MNARTQTHTARPELKGTKRGEVVSGKRRKTIKVNVDYLERHPKYGKYVRRRSTFHVDDPQEQAGEGDTVEIAPCRPISKTKAWRLVRVVETAPDRTNAPAENAAR